jgi:hypothetical protein
VENVTVSSEPTSDPLAYFDQLTATVEELGRSCWKLGQVITLADDAPRLTDAQLRDRLLALADHSRDGSTPTDPRRRPPTSSPLCRKATDHGAVSVSMRHNYRARRQG